MSKRSSSLPHKSVRHAVGTNKLVNGYMEQNDLIPENQLGHKSWDSVAEVSHRCWEALKLSGLVLPMLRDKNLLAHIADPTSLTNSAAVLARDAKDYRAQLEAIQAKHQQLKGNAQSSDELFEGIKLVEEYSAWLASYEAVVLPNAQRIINLFEVAGEAYLKEQQSN